MLFFFDNCFRCICVCFRTQTRAMYPSADTRAYPEVFHVLFSLASWLYPGKNTSSVGNIMWTTGSYICIIQTSSGVPIFWEFFFWKSGAKTARLIYVTSRNQTLIATFNKQRTAPRALVWRWLMLPSPHPTAPSLCHGPQGPKPGCFVLHCNSGLVTRPGWSSYLWVSLMREVTQNFFRKQRSKLRATDVEYLNKIIIKNPACNLGK